MLMNKHEECVVLMNKHEGCDVLMKKIRDVLY